MWDLSNLTISVKDMQSVIYNQLYAKDVLQLLTLLQYIAYLQNTIYTNSGLHRLICEEKCIVMNFLASNL